MGNFSDVDPAALAPKGRKPRDPFDALIGEWEILGADFTVTR